MSQSSYEQLLDVVHTVKDLASAASLAAWDQRVLMPKNGTDARGETLATLTRLSHEIFTAESTGDLLDSLQTYEASLDPDSDEAAIIRVTRRDYDKRKIYPAELEAEMARAENAGYKAWLTARESKNFGDFLPALERVVELKRQQIGIYKAAHPEIADDYDVMLDDFEPGLTAVEVDLVFDRLKAASLPLVQHVVTRAERVDNSFLQGEFDAAQQEALSREVAAALGMTDDGWRLDPTVHPFASTIALGDTRITTRYLARQLLSSYFGTMHEFGHGLYEAQVSPSLGRTTVQRGASMAWHESQSRSWENLIGRSRAHWAWATPVVQKHFPGAFDDRTPEDFYRASNKLGPSLIRVEADELTYNLHIILRYELERDIFARRVELVDLPEAWRSKMREYLGIEVEDDVVGVMQDVHWSEGLFGYFPTYALGNVVALQLWRPISAAIPDIDAKIAASDFADLKEWLRVNIHQHGRKYTPKELLQRVVGVDTFDPEPLIAYLNAKVVDLYGA